MAWRRVNRNKAFAKCVDCGIKRLVRTKEWDRAAAPRCYACGGLLERLADRTKSGSTVMDMRDCAKSRRNQEKEH